MADPILNNADAKRLREAIILLYKLNRTPEPPTDNSLADFARRNGDSSIGRVLNIEKEKQLAETLTFFTATTGDPRKVRALGIGEKADGQGLTISLAANHGDLQVVKNGLEDMTQILQREAKKGRNDNLEEAQQNLLRAAISLNRNRILCRLRSRHGKLESNFAKTKKGRPAIANKLREIIVHTPPSKTCPQELLGDLLTDVNRLKELFDQLESMKEANVTSEKGNRKLSLIVRTAHQINHRRVLSKVLNQSIESDSNLREYIIRTLAKLGRYVSASSNLLRAARQYSCFRSIEVRTIEYRDYLRLQYEKSNSVTASLIHRFGSNQILSQIGGNRASGKKDTLASLDNTLRPLAMADCAVHAEIQLLFHYEMKRSKYPPRVVCSTKKACYLCNAFFKAHGGFFIPSSHGRLYEKWAIPKVNIYSDKDATKRMQLVIRRFNEDIDSKIQRALKGGLKAYPSPPESMIFPSVIWSSPLQSVDLLLPTEDIVAKTPSNPQIASTFDQNKIEASPPILSSVIDQVPSLREATETSHRTSTTPLPPDACIVLQRGQSFDVDCVGRQLPIRVETQMIHLTLVYEEPNSESLIADDRPNNNPVEIQEKRFTIRFQLVGSEQAPESLEHASNFVDLDQLRPGVELVLDQIPGEDPVPFQFCRGSETVLMRYDICRPGS